jgi:DNA-binding MarR family transcriptional regulator
MLGIQPASVKQLVARGHLHSVPAPEDRRRRRVLRTEVDAYAREHAGKWSYTAAAAGVTVPARPQTQAPRLAISPELVVAGAASVGAAALLIEAFRREPEATAKLLIIGALIALALLLFLEWDRQGKLDAAERRRLEKLAKQAEAAPDVFLSEFEQLMSERG